jgi:hypothetical protein
MLLPMLIGLGKRSFMPVDRLFRDNRSTSTCCTLSDSATFAASCYFCAWPQA